MFTEKQQTAMNLARTAGFSRDQLEKFADLIAGNTGDGRIEAASDGAASVDDVAKTLRGVYGLTPAQRENVMKALKKDGHVAGDLSNRAMFASAESPSVQLMTPLECSAASPNNLALLRNVQARCRRIGYDLAPDKRVDVFSLNSCLTKAERFSVEDRISLKTDLAKLNLIA